MRQDTMIKERESIMSYDSRLYVVEKQPKEWTLIDEDGNQMHYGSVIAEFDLCHTSDVSNKMREYPATDTYIYIGDNTKVTKDEYGESLKEIPLEDAIEIIEHAAEKGDYRRYKPCLGLLKGFDHTEWERLVVLHYGY